MTTVVDIINRGLQAIGTRTTITAGELVAQSSNEAIQAALVYENIRDDLLRMAPWDCALNTKNLAYITSVPGTPENSSSATLLWEKGQPAPPWAYEYQYPNDCLRACWIIPATQTGMTGIPITTAVTGWSPSFWSGAPIRYKVQIDQFFPVTAAAVVVGGTGYVVGDQITLPYGPTSSAPIGAPVVLQVLTAPGGVIATVSVVNQIIDSETGTGGSYFAVQAGTIAQDTTTGVGVGATFTLTFGTQSSQRVILTNQEFATLAYVKQITDPNLMDTLFQSAWSNLIGATLAQALSGNTALANRLIGLANQSIMEARKVDGNEGLTINDVTPDFIRIRGIAYTEYYTGPFSGFDWGPTWSSF